MKLEGSNALESYKNLYRKAKSARERLESEWYLNIAFYGGDQWIFWNRGRIDRPRLEPWRVTLVDNRILPAVDSRVARKTKNRPQFTGTPFSADEEDLAAAELAEKLLEHNWITQHLSDKHFLTQKWSELTGAGFWKIYWDSTKGEKADYIFIGDQVFIGENGTPVRAEDAPPELLALEGVSAKPIAQGDVQIDVISPFELYPDPLATELHEAEWIIEEKVRSVDYIEKRYGQKPKEDTQIPVGIAESRMFPGSSTGSSGMGGRHSSSQEYMGVTVHELWAKPNKEYPEGKRCVWTRDMILLEDTLTDAPYDGCPYIMFPSLIVPGRFWPTSVTSQLRGPQSELNKLRSQIVENAQRLGNPIFASSRQANVEYEGVPGEHLRYDSTSPDALPQYVVPPPMPSYIQDEVERIIASITEISGVHEVSKASVPPGVTAASAINLLQEADDTRLGPEIFAMEKALADAGTKILKLHAKFDTYQRILRIAGEEGEWDIVTFKGTMLKKNTNVEVQAGSAIPRSKAAKQAAMQEVFDRLLQYGVPIDPRAMRKFFREFEVGGLDRLFETVSADEMQVRRENQRMIQGQAVNLNNFDNDDLHIAAHEELQKSRRYDQAPDEIKRVIDTHVKAHRERRVAMMDMQMKNMGMPAAPPEVDQSQRGNGAG